jgi:hypothetical protein
VWATYYDDLENPWAIRVNASYAEMVERGWNTANVDLLFPLPRQYVPRKVFGYDDDGNRRFAVIGHVEALVWTGQSSTFAIIANNGATALVHVAGRYSERRPPVTEP